MKLFLPHSFQWVVCFTHCSDHPSLDLYHPSLTPLYIPSSTLTSTSSHFSLTKIKSDKELPRSGHLDLMNQAPGAWLSTRWRWEDQRVCLWVARGVQSAEGSFTWPSRPPGPAGEANGLSAAFHVSGSWDGPWPRLPQMNETYFYVSNILISFNNYIQCLTLSTFRSFLSLNSM